MQKYRIEGLSDLVFGLALSIGSLAMINQNIESIDDVIRGIAWFGFGFLIIVNVWISYAKIMSERQVETEADFRLNILLLLLVSIEPFLLYMLGKEDSADISLSGFSTMLFAIDIGLIMLVLGMFQHKIVTSKEEALVHKGERDSHLVEAGLFLFSAIPIFWDVQLFDVRLRYVIWILSIAPIMYFKYMVGRKAPKAI
ncbi:MAG: hypothetical protein A4E32_01478 [Methanomassiliicoccales archaeon PtaU1.Bin124]|nr:MAG: hypothetical protein A4E32_01478 [Methanomassiliicoccales archaeon PtaU1.Bin124]